MGTYKFNWKKSLLKGDNKDCYPLLVCVSMNAFVRQINRWLFRGFKGWHKIHYVNRRKLISSCTWTPQKGSYSVTRVLVPHVQSLVWSPVICDRSRYDTGKEVCCEGSREIRASLGYMMPCLKKDSHRGESLEWRLLFSQGDQLHLRIGGIYKLPLIYSYII